ncbi:hypothetical protein [Plantactinospora sp. GCM10030261]|uniref:hypothetical protein n=1 Tax=Plantactinospora sp. GCM10030261 TaxID=3273420 RepID=UPI00360A585D
MPRTITRLLSTVTLAAAVAVVGTACGGGDTKAACDSIQQEMTNITSTGMQQTSDPAALSKTYSDGAEKIRGYGKDAGGDVEDAANDIAAAMEDLGKKASAGQMPDAQALGNAGIKLKNACE